jgi:hypothetical protein
MSPPPVGIADDLASKIDFPNHPFVNLMINGTSRADSVAGSALPVPLITGMGEGMGGALGEAP